MFLKLGGIWIRLYVIRSMSDVELPIRFESAHSVPKLFKFLYFRRLDCLSINTLSHAQSHSLQMAYKRKTTRLTWLERIMASASEAVLKKSCSSRGPIVGEVFGS